jgi:hypothetical protein
MSKTAPRSAINADKSRSSLQKELRDKLAWSVGTVLELKYAGKLNPVMIWADQLATTIVSSRLSQLKENSNGKQENWTESWEKPAMSQVPGWLSWDIIDETETGYRVKTR